MSKTIKDLDTEKDKAWRTKGHPHPVRELVPSVCPTCRGLGKLYTFPGFEEDCPDCQGLGEVYE